MRSSSDPGGVWRLAAGSVICAMVLAAGGRAQEGPAPPASLEAAPPASIAEIRPFPEVEAEKARAKGEAAFAAGNFAEAEMDFDDALKRVPDSPEIAHDRGRARVARGNLDGALVDYTLAAHLDPADIRFRAARAEVLVRQGDSDRAIAEYDAALAMDPNFGPGYSRRGLAWAARGGRDEEALDDLNRALEIDPSDEAARTAQEQILKSRAGADPAALKWQDVRYHSFQTVWQTINSTYFDPQFGGIDWRGVRNKYRDLLEKADDNAALRTLLQRMIGELRRSHFAIIPQEAAVFDVSQRSRHGTINANVAFIDGGSVVTGLAGAAAAAAPDLRPGDRIVEVDGFGLEDITKSMRTAGLPESAANQYLARMVESRLEGPVGKTVKLAVVGVDGVRRETAITTVDVKGDWSDPVGNFPSLPIEFEFKSLGPDAFLLRFNVFCLAVMNRIRADLPDLPRKGGLVVDLRGNGGGLVAMAAGICGWLSRSEFKLGTFKNRAGSQDLESYPQDGCFDGPIAILLDGLSASSSEIFAAGLQHAGRARIFGEVSAGAALPSLVKSLPNGDLFQYAVADMTTGDSGEIEGVGVKPDVPVVRTAADVAGGRDPVQEAALTWIRSREQTP